ncbi:MAG: glucosamine-6-phosphate deaminase, partial [Gemmatimonadota bacterium]|nr:glucosamine-6-phosphate deaminase [Gemmatimonadota bacterium]
MSATTALPPRERIPTQVLAGSSTAARHVAGEIAALIRARAKEGRRAVLGLATGSTPTGIYAELVRLHKEEGLSFRNVVTFNLDEYFPMRPEDLQSYVRFMREHLFSLVDIDPANAHVPDGTVTADQVASHCRRYEQMIADAGGIDLQLLGVGRTGHIGFNEPGSDDASRTRLITLDSVTRIDAASDFFGAENVPRRAITMGVGTILEARRIIMLAFGENKASIVARVVEGDVSPLVPATYLQRHANAVILLDAAAAAELATQRCPWLFGAVAWTPDAIRRAVIWLAEKLGKAVLKLTDADYNEE